jgi:hypothetical protein
VTTFYESVELARALLERPGRVSEAGLKREFDLDDEALDELVAELVDVQQVAAREGKILSWALSCRQPEARCSSQMSRSRPGPLSRFKRAPYARASTIFRTRPGIVPAKGVQLMSTKELGKVKFEDAIKCFMDNEGRIDPERDPVMYNINQGLHALAAALRNFSIQVKRELDSIESEAG